MAPRGTTRAAAAKPAKPEPKEVTVNGTGMSLAHNPLPSSLTHLGAGRGRAKKSETPAVNGTVVPPAKKAAAGKSTTSRVLRSGAYASRAAPRARTKKEETPAPAPKHVEKRKKDEESEPEPEPEHKPKKAKTKAVKEPPKPQPKGPRRVHGKKTEINAIRYTVPLKVFVFGEGSSGELGLGATNRAIDVKRPRFNEALTNMSVVRIATGGMHVVALTKDNQILTWGVNDNGALGRDTSGADVLRDIDDDDSDSEDETGGLNEKEATPTAISMEHFPEDTVFVDIAAGDSCSFALTTEGAVYGWGTFRVGISHRIRRISANRRTEKRRYSWL